MYHLQGLQAKIIWKTSPSLLILQKKVMGHMRVYVSEENLDKVDWKELKRRNCHICIGFKEDPYRAARDNMISEINAQLEETMKNPRPMDILPDDLLLFV